MTNIHLPIEIEDITKYGNSELLLSDETTMGELITNLLHQVDLFKSTSLSEVDKMKTYISNISLISSYINSRWNH